MALTAGTRLGFYEVIGAIGAGGMGEVYRARDTKLGRDVALKVLPGTFATDPDRLARFQREAQVLASLNHPNIATIHGFEDTREGKALVMELVDGPTLADRIAEGPMSIEDALPIARQIVDALDVAHGQGIVHRDLKPANIKVRPDGTVKVLDFGLARVFDPAGSETPAPSPMNSPTLTARATQMGMIIGTAAYMSPEQARGRSVDKRADIWAFGCVLFEMLTGRRLFIGEDLTDTLASVVKEQPDLAHAPLRVMVLLRKCLEKDPKKRLRDIGDAWDLIAGFDPAAGTGASRSGSQWVSRVPWVVAALAVVAATTLAVVHFREPVAVTPSVRFPLAWPVAPNSSALGGAHFFEVSPDSRYLAIVSDNALWVRPLDSLEPVRIDRTQGVTYPFWSPDSESIGFFQGGQLKVVSRAGGSIRIVCDAPDGRGGAWSPRGVILFSDGFGNNGLSQVPEQGGKPARVTNVAAAGPTDDAHRYPQFLPDGERFLFLHLTGKSDVAGVYAGSLNGSVPVRLLEDPTNGRFSQVGADGFLLFTRGDALMARAFDPAALTLSGTPFVVATGVGQGENTGLGAFSVGGNGTLVHAGTASVLQDLARVDRSGARLGAAITRTLLSTFSVAADGRIALDISPENRTNEADVWVMASGGAPSKFTFGPAPGWMFPVWSPKADQIAYATIDLAGQSGYEIRRKPSNMAGREEVLFRSTETVFLWDWSPDGKYLVFQNGGDLFQLPLEGDRKPVAFTKSSAEDYYGQVSPDGRWMAYASGDRNQSEVYVQPIPPTGALWQISKGGGTMPRWRRDGQELFYRAADGRLTAVAVSAGPAGTFSVSGGAQVLFPVPTIGNVQRFTYVPSKDGKQFVVMMPTAGAERPMTAVLNWRETVKR